MARGAAVGGTRVPLTGGVGDAPGVNDTAGLRDGAGVSVLAGEFVASNASVAVCVAAAGIAPALAGLLGKAVSIAK